MSSARLKKSRFSGFGRAADQGFITVKNPLDKGRLYRKRFQRFSELFRTGHIHFSFAHKAPFIRALPVYGDVLLRSIFGFLNITGFGTFFQAIFVPDPPQGRIFVFRHHNLPKLLYFHSGDICRLSETAGTARNVLFPENHSKKSRVFKTNTRDSL